MELSDLISLAAVAVAVLSWLDSRRRINDAAVAFRVEIDPHLTGWYHIRNVGSRSAGYAKLDLDSLKGFEVEGFTSRPSMEPGTSINVGIRNSRNSLPDTVRIVYDGFWRKRGRIVPFHPVRVVDTPDPTI